MKITVIGSGSWGTALAQVLADNKLDVIVYGHNKEEVDDINNGYNHKFFNNIKLNKAIKATTSLKEALQEVDMLVMCVPTKVMGDVLREIEPLLPAHKVYFVNASKGFDPHTNDRMSNTIRAIIPESKRYEVASVIGPSHAEEVIIRMYTAVASVSIDIEVAELVQELFSNDYFRLYTLTDEIGAEYGVALKNVLALCSGIVSGLGLGDNTRAALLTRGLQEIIKYGVYKGGKAETYLGLTGIGDLIVTATSEHSRNFQAGYRIGQEKTAKNVMADKTKTVEGIRTCKVVHDDIKGTNIEMPIVEKCYNVLYNDLDPMQAIDELMNRSLKQE
jgi:glycerol-3-phosphate dehydrogenase (NAD(P)+)